MGGVWGASEEEGTSSGVGPPEQAGARQPGCSLRSGRRHPGLGVAAGARPVPWGILGVQGSAISYAAALGSHRSIIVPGVVWLWWSLAPSPSTTLPFLPLIQNSFGPMKKAPPFVAQKSLPDLRSGARLPREHTRQPGRRPFLEQDTRAGTGTGLRLPGSQSPSLPGHSCSARCFLTPSFLPSQLAPGGALTKAEPAGDAGEEGQEGRISQAGLWGSELGATQVGGPWALGEEGAGPGALREASPQRDNHLCRRRAHHRPAVLPDHPLSPEDEEPLPLPAPRCLLATCGRGEGRPTAGVEAPARAGGVMLPGFRGGAVIKGRQRSGWGEHRVPILNSTRAPSSSSPLVRP